jgi:hypothetical protein
MSPRSDAVLADWHVHFHGCFELGAFLDAALDNFRAGAAELGVGADPAGALFLAEARRDRYFRSFVALAGREQGGDWSFRATDEETSLLAVHRHGQRLVVIAGRQIATREGLEVLALNSVRETPDGLGFDEALATARADGALAVVPWGFGKWWFRRGRIVARHLEAASGPPFYLGDNAGRPRIAPAPRLFGRARARGIWVLPGTDPLPFRSQMGKVARYGCALDGPIDDRRPAASLLRSVRERATQPACYGRLEGLGAFCAFQVAMLARKHGRLRG